MLRPINNNKKTFKLNEAIGDQIPGVNAKKNFTPEELKNEIIYILDSTGYKAYADLVADCFVYATEGTPVACMYPDKYILCINVRGIGRSRSAASFAIRHEILHQYLDHAIRASEMLGKEVYDNANPETTDRLNKAMDYEIHEAATEKDKQIIRQLKGLLLCDDFPEWATEQTKSELKYFNGLTFEEIYRKLEQWERENPPIDAPDPSEEYARGWNDLVEVFNRQNSNLRKAVLKHLEAVKNEEEEP